MILLGKVRNRSQYFTLLHSLPKEDTYVYIIKTVHLRNEVPCGRYIYSLYILPQQEHKYNKSALKQSD